MYTRYMQHWMFVLFILFTLSPTPYGGSAQPAAEGPKGEACNMEAYRNQV
jgi:hypothetical protein